MSTSTLEQPIVRYRRIDESWTEINLLGKPVPILRTLEAERSRRWLITTPSGRVVPFKGTEAETHAHARNLGVDNYDVIPRQG